MSNKLFLIGIDKYPNRPLQTCVKDVSDFENILLTKYDFDNNDVYAIYNEKATKKNIYDGFINYVRTLTDTDNLIVYYSGHGFFNKDIDAGYWVPFDGKGDDSSSFANTELVYLLTRIKAQHIFLIIDSCFSGTLLNTGAIKQISDYERKKSRWVLTSSYENAIDGTKDENSFFCETIIKFLNKENEDFKVSDLINYVKSEFGLNVSQTPQGQPLLIPGQEGGEFVFHIRTDMDDRKFKGYDDVLNILKFYKKKSKFSEIEKIEDKTNKIGYLLYREDDSVQKKVSYYLYLYEGSNLTQTCKFFYRKNPNLEKDRLIIFLPKERDQTHYEKRKQNVNSKFSPLNIFYIDEFISEQCNPDMDKNDDASFLSISNFVLPSCKTDEKNINDINSYIQNWFKEDENAFLVIKGTGGIGKTTFAQYMADKMQKVSKKSKILFIDSAQIKDKLITKSGNQQNINLYNFYEALCEMEADEKLDKELFRINVDAGNLLIIIDGLDEVISKIPNFNVTDFLQSINDTIKDIRGGKVIITCRTFFWENSAKKTESFPVIELLPFNEEQTNSFINKSFGENTSKQKRALKLVQNFKYHGEGQMHPYVLDIIRSIVNDQESIETDLSDFSSCYLKNKIKNDYIIFRICDRETKRIGQIDTDEQISFFIYLAVHKRGIIDKENFNDCIKTALEKHVDKTSIEAFKSHPFLYDRDKNILFKYDFLLDYFKSIYLCDYFSYTEKDTNIDDDTLNLIKELCWSGSPMVNDIASRFEKWDECDILNSSDIIKKIAANLQNSEDRHQVISNYFNVCLALDLKFKRNEIDDNTELLSALFATDGKITNLSIINLKENIRFNFSGLYFYKCHFDNFENFWKCRFDNKTIFDQCSFFNIPFSKDSINIPFENFKDCCKDENMENAFKLSEDNKINNTEKAKIFINNFFHLFYTNGHLGRQWEDKVILPRFSGIDKYRYGYKNIIEILKDEQVLITTKELNRNKMEIDKKYKEDISRFVKDGTMSTIIKNLIRRISCLK